MDSILPAIDIEEQFIIEDMDTVTEDVRKKVGRSFVFNNITKKFEFENGRNIEVDEKQAIKQWIALILRTYKDKVNIYKETNFNCNVEDLVGQKLNSFRESELKREITESLLRNTFIQNVSNFAITQNKSTLNVKFTVTLNNDENLSISEVI